MTAVVFALGAFASPALAALDLLALEVAVGVVTYWLAVRLLRVGAYRDVLEVLRAAPAAQVASTSRAR